MWLLASFDFGHPELILLFLALCAACSGHRGDSLLAVAAVDAEFVLVLPTDLTHLKID
jgi:hypothetical protein